MPDAVPCASCFLFPLGFAVPSLSAGPGSHPDKHLDKKLLESQGLNGCLVPLCLLSKRLSASRGCRTKNATTSFARKVGPILSGVQEVEPLLGTPLAELF